MTGKVDTTNIDLKKEVMEKENELREALKRLHDAQGGDGEDNDQDPLTEKPDTSGEKDQSQPKLAERSSSNVSLPPIDHILKSIDSYQTQQQLRDSQLLLELTQRPPLQTALSSGGAATTGDFSESDIKNFENTTDPSSQTSFYQRDYNSNNEDASPTFNQFNEINERKDLRFKNEDPLSQRKKRSLSSRRESTTGSPLTPRTDNNSMETETSSRHSSVDSADSPQSGSSTPNPFTSSNHKKRTNLPRETIDILNEWIVNNMDNPYPNHTQKRYLLEKTGLSNVQLSNWFINKRRRRIFSSLSGTNGQPIKKKRLIDRI